MFSFVPLRCTKNKSETNIFPEFFFFIIIILSSGGWIRIKLKLPHFHVSDTCRVSKSTIQCRLGESRRVKLKPIPQVYLGSHTQKIDRALPIMSVWLTKPNTVVK